MKRPLPPFVKTLMNKIHPPLLVTPQDSQNLSKLLKTSFREQLEAEHPESDEKNPTNTHLQSILSSPLFKKPTTKVVVRRGRQDFTLKQVQESLVSPLDFFRQQVAEGKATIHIAKYCLKVGKQNSTLYKNTVPSLGQNEDTESCQPILHWLWSSGLEDSIEFVHDKEFMKLMLTAMMDEGKDRQAWKWFHQLFHGLENQIYRNQADSLVLAIDAYAFFIKHLVSANVNVTPANLSRGIECFLRVADVVTGLKDEKISASLLHLSAGYLSAEILHKGSANIDTSLYERFQAASARIFKGRLLVKEALALCHPGKPDATLLIAKMKDPTITNISRMSEKRKDYNKRLYLAAAQLLISQNRNSEAQFVLDTLQDMFKLEEKKQTITHPKENKGEYSDEFISSPHVLAI
jgi:hypothetical protein